MERKNMHLVLIKNPDESKIIIYKLARILYAETHASSLCAVESLASMIRNLCISSKKKLEDIAADAAFFESLNKNSIRHDNLSIDSSRREFQMCLRVASRLVRGEIPDTVFGATKFHRADNLPQWAVARGSVYEIDGLSFYL
jgi:hypothetical protein